MNWNMVLAVLGVLFVNTIFLMATVHYKFEPRWVTSYLAVLLVYASLYFRRRRNLPPGLHRRLGHAAVTLIAFLSSSFFYNFAADVKWWIAIAVWIGLATAAYFFYDVVMFDTEEQDEGSPEQVEEGPEQVEESPVSPEQVEVSPVSLPV